MLKILLINILLVASPPITPVVLRDGLDCGKLKVTIEVANAEKGTSNGKAEAKVEGGVAPIYYIFFLPDGHLLKKDMDVSSNKVENLKPGKYFCSVTDGTGCVKKVEFEIE